MSLYKLFKISLIYFIVGCAGSSVPCGLFSSCGEQGSSPVVLWGLLTSVVPLVETCRPCGLRG